MAQVHVGELRETDMTQRTVETNHTHEPNVLEALITRRPVRLWQLVRVVVGCGALLSPAGCNDLTGSQQLPSGTPNPSFYNTVAGAVGMRNAAVLAFEKALPQYITNVGLLTDELSVSIGINTSNANLSGGTILLDERILLEGQADQSDPDYTNLQGARTLLAQAIGQLATYDTATADRATAKVMRGELYALEGYTEVLLADLFCSGVPLSTLDFQKDFTYQPGSTTSQVYQAAIAKFDTAISLSRDSARVLNMALVGKGRAWLDLGQYDSAAATVTPVPTDFLYQLTAAANWSGTFSGLTESDREGSTGLPYLSNGDPRTAAVSQTICNNSGSCGDINWPTKLTASDGNGGFLIPSNQTVTLAGGVEARLIETEAALHVNATDTTWLHLLNVLRATAPIPGTTQPATQQQLPPLADPGNSSNDSARVALLFAERAEWLFMTGTRQGDLRRLLRQYPQIYRSQAQAYPTGPYTAVGIGSTQVGGSNGSGIYGTSVNAPIPTTELVNPLFHGCLSRGA